jgi:pyruvate/2-oxoglutarate/acetoin dehydrogenase E1 component
MKGEVPEGDHHAASGEAAIIRPGMHCTVACYGGAVHAAMEAAKILSEEEIALEVLDLHCLVPLDREGLQMVIEAVR